MDLEVDRTALPDLDRASALEWIVTNGLGGYASGTLAGIASRRYHGLLVSARTPPVGRTVLVGGLDEWLTVGAERVALHAHEARDGTIDGDGYRRLRSFGLDLGLPVWRYEVAGTVVEKRVYMAYGHNVTHVRYEVLDGGQAVALELTPLVAERDHHDLTRPEAGAVQLTSTSNGVAWGSGAERRARFLAPGAGIARGGAAARWLRHREETARGEDDVSRLVEAAKVRVGLEPGRPWTLVLSDDPDLDDADDPEAALARVRSRHTGLLERAAVEDEPPAVRQLVLAADQFLVSRAVPDPDGGPAHEGRSVIAGYPWFNDWGRDTMIALPGLTLATGRPEEGATILRTFARFVRDGLVPNDFPDRAEHVPAYHTADASLWYVVAIHQHVLATADRSLVDDLLPTLRAILDHHIEGTRFGIGMDPSDGLLRAGARSYQLTWMDAKVEDWVVTPRRGKAVELEALWVNALTIVADWLLECDAGDDRGLAYRAIASRATASFVERFWRPDLGWLNDVVDGPDGDDPALRPNQLFAISLPHQLIDGAIAESVVEACRAALATPFGLRSLAPTDPAYRASFQGDRRTRDGAYHQGVVWSWLLGPYAEAVARTTGRPDAGLDVLRPALAHLAEAGIGSISEIFEPEPPFTPRGCIAQAWGVAEILRVWRLLERRGINPGAA